MKASFLSRGGSVFGAVVVIIGCSGSTGVLGSGGADGGAGGSGNGQSLGGTVVVNCTTNPTGPGCPCSTAGQSSSCWTGPANMRNVGACHDGTTQCQQNGEFIDWGPCQGQQLNCGSGTGGGGSEGSGGNGKGGGGAEDGGGAGNGGGGSEGNGGNGNGGGGAEDGGGAGNGGGGSEGNGGNGNGGGGSEVCFGCACATPTCTCTPGAVIGCDNDCAANLYCVLDAFQECQPDGTWGPCHEIAGMDTGLSGCWHDNANCGDCNNGGGQYLGDCSNVVSCK